MLDIFLLLISGDLVERELRGINTQFSMNSYPSFPSSTSYQLNPTGNDGCGGVGVLTDTISIGLPSRRWRSMDSASEETNRKHLDTEGAERPAQESKVY